MNSITEIQKSIFSMLKNVICDSVEAIPVNKGAIKVTTPFIDWKGYSMSIYVTKEGKITDGGDTINQLLSLRVIDEFEEWPFQEDFFNRYQIQRSQSSLEPVNPESEDTLLSYLQGIARIPGLFEAKPIYSTVDNYPTIVRNFIKESIIEEYKIPASEVVNYTNPRTIILQSGIKIQNDVSPKNPNNMIKIISHASGSSTDKRQHVGHKVLDSVLWKRENSKVRYYPILENLEDYPRDSQNLLETEAEKIIETKEPESKYELAEIIVTQQSQPLV